MDARLYARQRIEAALRCRWTLGSIFESAHCARIYKAHFKTFREIYGEPGEAINGDII
jgi:hypothetical protein